MRETVKITMSQKELVSLLMEKWGQKPDSSKPVTISVHDVFDTYLLSSGEVEFCFEWDEPT